MSTELPPSLSVTRPAMVHEPSTEVLATTAHTVVTQQTSPRGATDAVVMSWAGGAPNATGIVDPSGPAFNSEDLPPSYETARIPTQPITYIFSPQSFNSMLLLPPPESQDTRPLYHISVAMNCFIPSSYVTTIRRGASEYGDYVAEFEIGNSEDTDTVTIHGKQRIITAVLNKSGSRLQGTYTWRGRLAPHPHSKVVTLQWAVNGPKKKCTLDLVDEPIITLARFEASPKAPPVDGQPKSPTTITILPAAHKYPGLVDQIVLSALIIERQRLIGK